MLRDGAAAQYGSDALAGVVNIVLRRQTDETHLSFEAGGTYEGDGQVLHGGANTGFELGDDGFLNMSVEYRDREDTNRAGEDTLRVEPPRVTQRIGDANAKDGYVWINGGLPIGLGELYWFGGFLDAMAILRVFSAQPKIVATCRIYIPMDFLPNLIATVEDGSLAVGYRAPLGDSWDWDMSINHGRSRFGFQERNTVNVSWWYEPNPNVVCADPPCIYAQSPTSADTGTLD